MMNLYRVYYFDMIAWNHVDRRFLAESEEQVIDYINSEISKSCRIKPYRSKDEPEEDSLEISVLRNDIKLPCDIDDIDTWG